MPTLAMTNNPYRSWSSSPLDLRTTRRDRGTGIGIGGGGRHGVPADTSASTSTGAGTCNGTGLRRAGVAEHRPSHAHASTVSSARRRSPASPPRTPASSSDPGTPPLTDGGAADRRALLDKSPFSLPLRKRPFPSVPAETLRRTQDTRGVPRLSLTETTTDAAARVYRREAPPPFPDGYPPPGHAHAFNSYAGHPHLRYPPYSFTTVHFDPRVPLQPLSRPAEHPLVSNIAMAMCQDEDGDTPLHIAVAQGNVAVVHKLINIMEAACKNLNIYNNLRQTPLHLAVITQQEGLVEGLLSAGADPTSLDRHGRTALHLCCEYGQAGCLSTLLSHSSSFSCLDVTHFEGLSPLHIAVQGGHKDLVRMLLEAGADINAKDIKSGQSPLMYAVESNNVDMVHFLIESGSDVNGQSNSGNTALHGACGRGQVETVRLLLKNGADYGIKNNHNDTPIMVAKNKKIADVLRGKSSKLIRSQDQPLAVSSSHSSNLTASGSSTPNQSPNFHL